MKKIGLTGGIATGKSTVLEHWARTGGACVTAIESDHLAHQAYAPGSPTYAEVLQNFGKEIVNEDGTVNRRRLGAIVFADDQKRLALNRIVHPAVRQMWESELARLATGGATEVAIVAIPLLFEVGAERSFDSVVAVGCSELTQLARLAAKGLTADQARARIRAQWPLQSKLDRADFVIWNDGQPDLLTAQADTIWQLIKETRHAASQD